MQSDRNVVLICTSPKAGSGANRALVPDLTERLQSRGFTVHVSSDIDEITRLATHHQTQDDLLCIAAAGGDGTLSLVASKVSPEVTVMPLPLGTENLLARYIGQTPSVDDALATISSGKTVCLDAGEASGKLFLIMCSAGFDAEVVHQMHRSRRGHISKLSYLKPIVKSMWRYMFPKILVSSETSDRVTPLCWTFVFNLPRYGGGLPIAPSASGTDGRLNLIGFEQGSFIQGLRYLYNVWRQRHLQLKDVHTMEVARIELKTANPKAKIPYQLDGDFAGYLPVSISVKPRRFRLLVPADCPIDFADQEASEVTAQ